MKTLKFSIVVLILFLSTLTLSAQDFRLSTQIGQGVKINSEFETELFQTSIELTPTISWNDQFMVSAVTMSYINNDETNYFAGSRLGVKVFEEGKTDFHITADGLLGNTGSRILYS